LWIGGAIMALGTMLAAFPGSRRRLAIDPVSAPILLDGPDPDGAADGDPGVDTDETEDSQTEVPV
jgi:cytochrome c-type biogenesis protein CcmF